MPDVHFLIQFYHITSESHIKDTLEYKYFNRSWDLKEFANSARPATRPSTDIINLENALKPTPLNSILSRD